LASLRERVTHNAWLAAVVQLAVKMIDVIAVADGRMAAAAAVLVVIRVAAHAVIPSAALRTTPIHGRRHPSNCRI
jgi:hypothetical protein